MVIGPWSGSDPPAPSSAHVLVDAGATFDEVLRALEQAEARVALVTEVSGTTGRSGVVGVITERHIARVACAEARLTE